MSRDATLTASRRVPEPPRTGGARRPFATAGWPLLVVAAVIVLNLPALVHLVDVNPLGPLGYTASKISGQLLPGQFFKDPDVGYTAQALGHRAALDWLHGIVPWWNPYEGIGAPLAAEMQSAAFYPPVLLFALRDGSLYFHVTMEAAAGLGAYYLCRELSFSRPVACVGGIMFAFSGTFAWLWHAPMNPVPLLPFSLLGVERIIRRPASDSGWIILAVALALSVYAGFPESAYLDLLLVVAWALVRLALAAKGERLRIIRRYLLGGGTGLLLAMPLVLAFVEYLPYADTGRHGPGQYVNEHFGLGALPTLGLPYLYGPIDAFHVEHSPAIGAFWGSVGGFVTASALAAGIVGLIGARRDRGLRIFLAASFLAVVLWVFGVFPFTLLWHLPYARHISVVTYSPPMFVLPAILLACFGLEALGQDGRARISAGLAALALVAFGAGMLGATPGKIVHGIEQTSKYASRYPVGTLVWAGVMVGGVALLGLLRRNRWARAACGLLLVADASLMCFVPELSAPRVETLDLAPASYLASHVGLGRFYGLWNYHGDYGSYFGIGSIDTSDNPVPKPWVAEEARLAPNLEPYRFDGRLVVVPPPAVVDAVKRISSYEAIDVRYYLTAVHTKAYRYLEHRRRMRRVYDDGFIAIFALPHPAPFFRTLGARCSLSSSGFDRVQADCPRPVTLVRAELYMPGWTATVNGRPATVLDHDRLLGAVHLPAGRSTVSFSYAPSRLGDALVAFLAGFVLLAGVPLGRAYWRRRHRVGGETQPATPKA